MKPLQASISAETPSRLSAPLSTRNRAHVYNEVLRQSGVLALSRLIREHLLHALRTVALLPSAAFVVTSEIQACQISGRCSLLGQPLSGLLKDVCIGIFVLSLAGSTQKGCWPLIRGATLKTLKYS